MFVGLIGEFLLLEVELRKSLWNDKKKWNNFNEKITNLWIVVLSLLRSQLFLILYMVIDWLCLRILGRIECPSSLRGLNILYLKLFSALLVSLDIDLGICVQLVILVFVLSIVLPFCSLDRLYRRWWVNFSRLSLGSLLHSNIHDYNKINVLFLGIDKWRFV